MLHVWLEKLVKHFVTCNKLSHVTCLVRKVSETLSHVTSCHMLHVLVRKVSEALSHVTSCHMLHVWLEKLVKHFVTCHKLSHVTCFG